MTFAFESIGVNVIGYGNASRTAHGDRARITARRSDLLSERLDFLSELPQRNENRHPAIGDPGRLAHAFRRQRGDEDRDIGTDRFESQLEAPLEREHLALVMQRLLGQDHADNLDVFPQSRKGWLERYPVPVFDDAVSACAEADQHAAATQLIQGREMLGQRRRRARVGVDNAAAQGNAPGFAGQHRQHGKAVTAPRFRHPNRIDPSIVRSPHPRNALLPIEWPLPVETHR